MLNDSNAQSFADNVMSVNHLERDREGLIVYDGSNVGIKYVEDKCDDFFYTFASPPSSYKKTLPNYLKIVYAFADNSCVVIDSAGISKCYLSVRLLVNGGSR